MKAIRSLLPLLCTVLLGSCWPVFKNQNGKFMKDVVNLADFNTADDDYNSNLPMNKHGEGMLIFSSNRKDGKTFNLVNEPFYLRYDDKTDKLSAQKASFNIHATLEDQAVLNDFVQQINGPWNVLGPYSISYEKQNTMTCCYGKHRGEYAFFYTDDKDGDLNIRMVENYKDKKSITEPLTLHALNSKADDAYPSFRNRNKEVYFCSNRDGSFDIYRATLPEDSSLARRFSSSDIRVEKVHALSSSGDDKCPFVVNNLMVFVSNRSGGLGGYDIYYSIFNGNQWSTPANAGRRINTPQDEYRPILFNNQLGYFDYPLMIFSSNRPGGKGGFDLYLTGLIDDKHAVSGYER